MKYFKNKNNEIFAYDEEQVKQGCGKALTPITENEKDELLKPTAKQIIQQQTAEAKAYLSSTDFYMTVDKYEELTIEKQLELKTKRAEARECINTLEAELIILQGAN